MTEFNRKLFNKGASRIDHDRGAFHPQTAGAFTEIEAAKILRLYKSQIIDMDNVTVESLTTSGAADKATEQAEKDKAEIAKRLEDARILRKQKAYEDALADGFAEAEAREIAGLPPLAGEEDQTANQKDGEQSGEQR